jgi:hypothetical protein
MGLFKSLSKLSLTKKKDKTNDKGLTATGQLANSSSNLATNLTRSLSQQSLDNKKKLSSDANVNTNDVEIYQEKLKRMEDSRTEHAVVPNERYIGDDNHGHGMMETTSTESSSDSDTTDTTSTDSKTPGEFTISKNNNSQLIVTTTNQGADNISSSTFASFDDCLFAASGFTFSISNGELIATI